MQLCSMEQTHRREVHRMRQPLHGGEVAEVGRRVAVPQRGLQAQAGGPGACGEPGSVAAPINASPQRSDHDAVSVTMRKGTSTGKAFPPPAFGSEGATAAAVARRWNIVAGVRE